MLALIRTVFIELRGKHSKMELDIFSGINIHNLVGKRLLPLGHICL